MKVEYRSLSRNEVGLLAAYGEDTAGAEAFMLSRACGITEEEAAAWRQATGTLPVMKLLNDIGVLSGIRAARKGPKE